MVDHTSSLTNHNPSNYTQHASFVYSDKYSSPVLDLLNAQPGESIVDLGCGTGQLTEKIKAIVGTSGTVCGIDSSASMVSTEYGLQELTFSLSTLGLRTPPFSTSKATSKTTRLSTLPSRASLTLSSRRRPSTGASQTLVVL